ncbi:uncharacterized protein ISCGN_002281 [Ixodes scapularis]
MICARKRHALQPLPAYFLSDLDLAQTVTLPASQEPAQPGSPLASAGAPDTDDVIASDHQYSITGCIDQALRDRIRQLEELASANEKLRKDNDRLQKENEALRKKVAHLEEMYDKAEEVIDATIPFQNFTLTAVQQDPKKLAFYTGFDSLERFLAFYKFVQAGYEAHKESQGPQRRSPYLSMDDQLLLVLSRLRVGLLEQDLAYRFRIHISTVSRVWTFWIGYLADYLAQLNYWPSRQVVNKHMPECFIEAYPSTRVILDCTEIFIETPSDFRVQSDTYSSYKCHNTAKGLLGITPNGFVSFVSDLAPGRVSDKALTACSGLCNLLEPGDSVMADRGFLITEEVEAAGANLNIPPFLGGRLQLSLEDEAKTRAIAKVRIHVERESLMKLNMKVSDLLELHCPECILMVRPNKRTNLIAADTRNSLASCLLVAAVLCCSGILTVAQARSCPEAADFLPCTCDMGGIGCGKANSTAVLTKAFQTDGPKEHRDLWIQRSTVESFPPGVLGDFVFRNVYIEVNANLTSFNLSSLNKSRTFIMKLSLFGNALTTFAYSGIGGFPKLIMLNLGKNRLERIPDNAFQHPKLTKLVLSDNPIQAVGAYAFFALPKLEMLHLTGTRITRLGNYALSLRSRVPKLKVLLSEGNLASLSPLAFSDTRAQMLCLGLNNLTEFPRDVFFPILEQLGQRRQVTWEVSTLRVTGEFSHDAIWNVSLTGVNPRFPPDDVVKVSRCRLPRPWRLRQRRTC